MNARAEREAIDPLRIECIANDLGYAVAVLGLIEQAENADAIISGSIGAAKMVVASVEKRLRDLVD